MKASAHAARICKNPTVLFVDLRILWPKQVVRFNPKSTDMGHQIFQSKNGMTSNFRILSTTAIKQQNDR